ncbi:MAG: ATP-binding protein [Defluviitaleaceae bacterium]|nr:ATP-binding protein [Defluviitaleaceae bacterium]
MIQVENKRKKLPHGISAASVISFFIVLILCGFIIGLTVRNSANLERLQIEQLITERGIKINEAVTGLLYKTSVLSVMVTQGYGVVDDFERLASSMVDDPAILNVLIAPGGVVTHVFSLHGDESALIGFDFLSDATGNREAIMAIEAGELVMAGPFIGRQGLLILAGRLPVFLDLPDGTQEFWGLVSVTLRFPEALENVGFEVFTSHGYAYELWRTDPETGERQTMASDYDASRRYRGYIERPIEIFNATWHLKVSHTSSIFNWNTIFFMVGGFLISVLVAYIVQSNYELKKIEEELEEAVEAKSMFLANMSHEIRTPLNGVIGFAELALEEKNPQASREYMVKNLNNATSLLDIVNNILDISKIESGKMKLDKIAFDLCELLEACKSTVEPKAIEKNISLQVQADTLKITGDPTKLRQVLLNLLSNAVKFTESGAVRISAAITNNFNETVKVLFEVEDSGIGMSEEHLRHIFDAFAQADAGITRKYGGTGLGLAISKNYVELMGGTLSVESVQDVGTKFSFSLVFDTASADDFTGGEKSFETENSKFSGEALICEDNKINQEIMIKHLENAGMFYVLAENGKQGVDIAAERINRPFDIIFMDIQMPVMDGISASKALVEMGIKTPIIAVSADASADKKEKYKQVGMTDCLSKPFKRQELWACLQKYLRNEIIDFEMGIEHCAGCEEIHKQGLEMFFNKQRNVYEQVENAIKKGDYSGAGAIIHRERGVAGIIGAVRLMNVLNDLQDVLDTGINPSVDLMETYSKELDNVLERIKTVT